VSVAVSGRRFLVAFLLFAAVLFAPRGDASIPSASAPQLEHQLAPPSEPIVPSRFGLGEDVSVFDASRAQLELGLCGLETCRCEITYARNNPLKYVDPDGQAAAIAIDVPKITPRGVAIGLAKGVASRIPVVRAALTGWELGIQLGAMKISGEITLNEAVTEAFSAHLSQGESKDKEGEKEKPAEDKAAAQKGERAKEGTAGEALTQLEGISDAQAKDRTSGTGQKIEDTSKSEQRLDQRNRRIKTLQDAIDEYE
jgi:hypothetical protein